MQSENGKRGIHKKSSRLDQTHWWSGHTKNLETARLQARNPFFPDAIRFVFKKVKNWSAVPFNLGGRRFLRPKGKRKGNTRRKKNLGKRVSKSQRKHLAGERNGRTVKKENCLMEKLMEGGE